MAQLPNANAFTVSDGLTTYINYDTVGKHEVHSNAGQTARLVVWDGSTSLWYPVK